MRGGGVHAARGTGSASQARADAGRTALPAVGGASRRDDPARGAGIPVAAGRRASASVGAGRMGRPSKFRRSVFFLPTATEDIARAFSIFTNGICSPARGRSGVPMARRSAISTNAKTIFSWRRPMPRWPSCWLRGERKCKPWCRRFGRCRRLHPALTRRDRGQAGCPAWRI